MRRKKSVESGKKPGAVKEDDGFVARRSLHVTGPTNADGDTWQETLAGTNESSHLWRLLCLLVMLSICSLFHS
jgi:hypothetical protein